jgi:uncharacterized membrane-anchored protein YhcB (DUF1043 family)
MNLIILSIIGFIVGFIGYLFFKIIINRFIISKYIQKEEEKEKQKNDFSSSMNV